MARRYKAAIIGAGNIAALFDDPQSKEVLTPTRTRFIPDLSYADLLMLTRRKQNLQHRDGEGEHTERLTSC